MSCNKISLYPRHHWIRVENSNNGRFLSPEEGWTTNTPAIAETPYEEHLGTKYEENSKPMWQAKTDTIEVNEYAHHR